MINAYRRWASYRKTVNELSALPDYALKDIGVSRCEIYRFAKEVGRP